MARGALRKRLSRRRHRPSGTSGHAVLELNQASGAHRRFVLIEQGRPERGDPYARSLTAERVRRAISGQRVSKDGEVSISAEPLLGGFRFCKMMAKVDAAAVLALEREEMIDLLLTTHWDQGERSAGHLRRLPAGTHSYLFAKSALGGGYFLIWSGPERPSVLNREAFRAIVAEAKSEGLSQPFHVYARIKHSTCSASQASLLDRGCGDAVGYRPQPRS
jgi:adenine-specific DNA-methyltransferase